MTDYARKIRRANNQAKQAWMDRFWPGQGGFLFDAACGRGGDMWKWTKLPGDGPTRVVGFDLNRANLEQFMTRLTEHETKLGALQVHLFQTDLRGPKDWCTGRRAFLVGRVELVTCNFALHFAFGAAEHLDHALRQVAALLRDGCYMIGACLDGTRLLRRARENVVARIPAEIETVRRIPFAFGEIEGTVNNTDADFGQTLHARLTGAPSIVGEDGSHEFVLRLSVLEKHAARVGLELVAWEAVHPDNPADCHSQFAFRRRFRTPKSVLHLLSTTEEHLVSKKQRV
jgi:hypothetical protein